jgi:uncharacterized membrane protein YhaH (DUF805 family)
MAFQYFLDAYRKFGDFKGRARRSEFWYWYLFFVLGLIVLATLGSFLGTFGYVLYGIFLIGSLIPSLSLSVRRMHDAGKSGWFLLIPIYGMILHFIDSEPGTNKWGPNPKENNQNSQDLIEEIGQ